MSTKRVPSSVVLLTLLMLSCFSAPVWSQAVAIESVVESDAPRSKKESVTLATPAGKKEYDLSRIRKSDVEWRKQLSRKQFEVTRRAGTERARTGRYWNLKAKGTYHCVCCNLPLFSSMTKYKSGTGWPSFYAPLDKKVIAQKVDRKMVYPRQEVLCIRCDAHLGHVFSDGPKPTGLRYCLNSAALKFESADAAKRRAKKEAEAAKEEEEPAS